jgi:hypothetical protein
MDGRLGGETGVRWSASRPRQKEVGQINEVTKMMPETGTAREYKFKRA